MKNNSKTLLLVIAGIALLVLVVAIVVVVSSGRRSKQTPSSIPQSIVKPTTPATTSPVAATGAAGEVSEQMINITSQGFAPNQITVAKGTMVQFTNSDSRIHDVASAPHPTHTDLPQLRSGSLAPGESYSFTFSQVGTSGYHDHLTPSLRGTVTVTP